MATSTMFSYQRLTNKSDDQEEEGRVIERPKRWLRVRRFAFKKKTNVRIPVLNKFLKRKNKLVHHVMVSWAKILKRFKDSSGTSHLGDIFAGNYLFLQVNPSSFNGANMGYQLHGLPPRHTLKRIA